MKTEIETLTKLMREVFSQGKCSAISFVLSAKSQSGLNCGRSVKFHALFILLQSAFVYNIWHSSTNAFSVLAQVAPQNRTSI